MKKMIFLKVKNSYNKKLVTWLDLNLQVAPYKNKKDKESLTWAFISWQKKNILN